MSCEQLHYDLFGGLPLPRCRAYVHGLAATSDPTEALSLRFFPPVILHVEGGGKDLFTRWHLAYLLILIILVLIRPPAVPLGIQHQKVEEAEEDEGGREECQQEGGGRGVK